MVVRHGVMLVGPTGGGKTTCYDILADTLGTLKDLGVKHPQYEHVVKTIMNPKAGFQNDSFQYLILLVA